MAKALDARYEAGQRGQRWFKIKPVHTLDLVVLAAEWGKRPASRLAQQPSPWRPGYRER
jgi:ATP-dependent DNA ligase